MVLWSTEGGTGNEPGVGSKQPPAYLQSTPVHLKANVKLVQTARRQHYVYMCYTKENENANCWLLYLDFVASQEKLPDVGFT